MTPKLWVLDGNGNGIDDIIIAFITDEMPPNSNSNSNATATEAINIKHQC